MSVFFRDVRRAPDLYFKDRCDFSYSHFCTITFSHVSFILVCIVADIKNLSLKPSLLLLYYQSKLSQIFAANNARTEKLVKKSSFQRKMCCNMK